MRNLLLIEGFQNWLESSNLNNSLSIYFLIGIIIIFIIFILNYLNVPSRLYGFFIILVLIIAILLGLIGVWVAVALSVFGFLFFIIVIQNVYF